MSLTLAETIHSVLCLRLCVLEGESVYILHVMHTLQNHLIIIREELINCSCHVICGNFTSKYIVCGLGRLDYRMARSKAIVSLVMCLPLLSIIKQYLNGALLR